MGKDIRVFIPSMKDTLNGFEDRIANLIETYHIEIQEEYHGAWSIRMRLEELIEEINHLKSYMKICLGTLERIPESNKRIGSIKKQLNPLNQCLNEVNLDCVLQSQELILIICDIKFLREGIRN